jgi:hypothetical protein
MQLSPLPSYFAPLRPTYPQRPILEHPQPKFLPQGARTRFTIIEYNRKNYNSVHLNLSFFYSELEGKRSAPNDSKTLPEVSLLFIYFFVNVVLICQGCSQTFEMFMLPYHNFYHHQPLGIRPWQIDWLIDSTTGNAPRPYVGRPFVPHIWNGSFRLIQRHSASTDARGLY